MLEELRGLRDVRYDHRDPPNRELSLEPLRNSTVSIEQNTRDPVDVRRELERVMKKLDERAAKEKRARHPAVSKS